MQWSKCREASATTRTSEGVSAQTTSRSHRWQQVDGPAQLVEQVEQLPEAQLPHTV